MLLSLDACRISGHLDGTSTEPQDPIIQDVAAAQLTKDEQKAATTYQKEQEWRQSEVIVKQKIVSTTPNSLFMKVRGEKTAKEI